MFVSTVLLLSLLEKTPLHGVLFHASCAVAYICVALFLGSAQPTRTLKGARGLRLKAIPPETGESVAFALASTCTFFITTPFLAASPYFITVYLSLPSHERANIPVMICSFLLGLSTCFGGAPATLSAFASSLSLLCRGAISHRATTATWWWCAAAHGFACTLSYFYVTSNWNGLQCIIPAFLGIMHVASTCKAAIALTRTKKEIRRASHIALCLTFVIFPAFEMPKIRRMLLGGIFKLCLASGSLWYYNFDSEWSGHTRPFQIAPSWFGITLGVYALCMYYLGNWLLP